jgi:hypothetical protein
MDPMFEVHMLNDEGKGHAKQIAESFNNLLQELQQEVGAGTATREFSLCKTKLEEACFFAKKAMASQPRNQQQ